MQTEKTPTNKRIIYIGDFIQPYSTERYITHAFTEIGYEVVCIQEDRLCIKNAKEIFEEVQQMSPYFVLFSKGRPIGESEQFINLMLYNGIKTIVWLFDLYFDLPSDRKFKLEQKIAPFNSEIIFSTDGGHQKNFEDLNINHKLLRQGIHEPEAILYDLPKIHEIVFVGGDVYHTRRLLIKGLKEHYGEKFEWYGFHPKNYIRGLKLNELYSSTKVVVGDSQPSPKYWSNRIYETLGRGGFLIHPYVEGLEEEFEIGKDLVCFPYGDFDKLHELIDYYLEHEEEREEIRKHGFEKVKNNYTYKKRCEQLFKMI